MVIGGLAAIAIGFPTFRLRGHYFALSMLAYPLAILYVMQYLGFQEVSMPDAPRQRGGLHGVQRSARVHAAGRPPAGGRRGGVADHRELALRPGAARHPAERAGGGGGGHRRAPVEDALAGGVGNDGRGGRRLLRARAAGRHAGFRVRHARLRAGGGGHAVRRRGLGVGAGDRRGHPGAAGRDAAGRAGHLSARHPGRGLRRRDHRGHAAVARRALLDRPRPLAAPRGAAADPRPFWRLPSLFRPLTLPLSPAASGGTTERGRSCRSKGCRAPSAGSARSAR